MDRYTIQSDTLIKIADEIRTLNTVSDKLTPVLMESNVNEVNDAVDVQKDLIDRLRAVLSTKYLDRSAGDGLVTRILEKYSNERLTVIGAYAFNGCMSLITLILPGDSLVTLSNANALSDTPIASGTGFLYVPSALVEEYKAATNWSTYGDQIRAIEDYPDITGG